MENGDCSRIECDSFNMVDLPMCETLWKHLIFLSLALYLLPLFSLDKFEKRKCSIGIFITGKWSFFCRFCESPYCTKLTRERVERHDEILRRNFTKKKKFVPKDKALYDASLIHTLGVVRKKADVNLSSFNNGFN